MPEQSVPICGVAGNPIGHSKSPVIHQQFAAQFDMPLEYQAHLVAVDGFTKFVHQFQSAGGLGLNITLPFKAAAFELADESSEAAQQAKAANTLVLSSDRIVGENTDGVGLLRDIESNLGVSLQHCRLLVLGAGGAVRGILHPLLRAGPDEIVIANRTPEKADLLAGLFTERVFTMPLESLAEEAFDVVLNATSASLAGELPCISAEMFNNTLLAYDLMYANRPTPFMNLASKTGVEQVSDGLGMLVEQAAVSFLIWHGQMPDTRPVIDLLRQQ